MKQPPSDWHSSLPPSTRQTLGQNIARVRWRQGMTQAELARRVGVSRQQVAKWERDEADPRWSHVQRTQAALPGLDLNNLRPADQRELPL